MLLFATEVTSEFSGSHNLKLQLLDHRNTVYSNMKRPGVWYVVIAELLNFFCLQLHLSLDRIQWFCGL